MNFLFLQNFKLNAQKSAFERTQALNDLNQLKNKLRNRVPDPTLHMFEFNKESSNYPINVVRYSKLNEAEYPIVKFGADPLLMKKLIVPENMDFNNKLNDLMNDEFYKRLLPGNNNNEEKEFRGESEFVDFGGRGGLRRNSLNLEEKKIDALEEIGEKKVSSEKNFEETTKFVTFEKAEKSGGFENSGGLGEMFQILRNIDEIQNRREENLG